MQPLDLLPWALCGSLSLAIVGLGLAVGLVFVKAALSPSKAKLSAVKR